MTPAIKVALNPNTTNQQQWKWRDKETEWDVVQILWSSYNFISNGKTIHSSWTESSEDDKFKSDVSEEKSSDRVENNV